MAKELLVQVAQADYIPFEAVLALAAKAAVHQQRVDSMAAAQVV